MFLSEGRCGQDTNNDALIIYGVGYPPIKAQSLAQAHLMAKRAAIVDAYRNALAMAGAQNYTDEELYKGLSGFVKGLKILDEEYLEDGGIRITAPVARENVTVASVVIGSASKIQRKKVPGPIRVTLEEWYKILKNLVTTEK